MATRAHASVPRPASSRSRALRVVVCGPRPADLTRLVEGRGRPPGGPRDAEAGGPIVILVTPGGR